MSKGPGRVMRAALAAVRARDKSMHTLEVAAEVYGLRPDEDGITRVSQAQTSAVRRALAQLVRRGEVRDLGIMRWGLRRYASPEVAARIERSERATFGYAHRPVRPIPGVRMREPAGAQAS